MEKIEMQITAIGDENYAYFAPFLGDERVESHGYLGVIEDGLAIAAAEFAMDSPVLIVKNIYVDPDHRRRGAGRMLIEAAAETAETVGIYDILAYYGGEKEATSFYKGMGFTCHPCDDFYSVPLRMVCTLKQYKSAKKKLDAKDIVAFDVLTSTQRSKLVEMITNRFDLTKETFQKGAYDPRLSLAFIGGDGEAKGVIMAGAKEQDVYVTAYVVIDKDQKTAPMLLTAFVQEIEKSALANSHVYFLGRNEKLIQSLRFMLGDKMKKVATGWSATKNITS